MSDNKAKTGTVALLGGSLRIGSICQDILGFVAKECESLGVGVELFPLSNFRPNLFEPDCTYENVSDVQSYLSAMRAATTVVWCVPAYHGGFSGAFKNAIDYLDLLRDEPQRFLSGKTVFIVTVGAGVIAPVTTARMLVDVAHALRASVHPTIVPIKVDINDTAENWPQSSYNKQLLTIARTASAITLRQSIAGCS